MEVLNRTTGVLCRTNLLVSMKGKENGGKVHRNSVSKSFSARAPGLNLLETIEFYYCHPNETSEKLERKLQHFHHNHLKCKALNGQKLNICKTIQLDWNGQNLLHPTVMPKSCHESHRNLILLQMRYICKDSPILHVQQTHIFFGYSLGSKEFYCHSNQKKRKLNNIRSPKNAC